MASAGIRPLPSGSFKVYWRLDDGSQGSATFPNEDDAVAYHDRLKVQWRDGTWVNPQRGRITFKDWANQWWETWASEPGRSPNGKETTDSHLRVHVLPAFGSMQLRAISVQSVQRWQNKLAGARGHSTVTACRSILYRILQAAEDDGRIPVNPVHKVKAPKKLIDPEARFARTKRRTLTPEEFGRLLAAAPASYRDHFLVQAGTGLRPGELLGLRTFRVDVARGHLEILDVRYEAGKFGSGYKDRPKSAASIRPAPMCPTVVKVVTGRVQDAKPTALVFPGPGGGPGRGRGQGRGVKRGAGSGLSTGNYRRAFKAAVADLNALEDPEKRLTHLDLRGPHALRATYATWLEDAGIPSRVIDELMGHEGGRPERGTSRMGALYRETTPAMLTRVCDAIEERLTVAQDVAARLLPEMDERRRSRMPRGKPRKQPQAV